MEEMHWHKDCRCILLYMDSDNYRTSVCPIQIRKGEVHHMVDMWCFAPVNSVRRKTGGGVVEYHLDYE